MKEPVFSPIGFASRPLEFNAERYVLASDHQQEWGRGLIAELRLRGNERILDLGCGDGRLTVRLAELVPQGSVIGLDASTSMIQAAKQHWMANLEFVQGDIEDIDFRAEFDLVFSNAALHWIKDHTSLLQRVFRALRSGGVARFSFGGADNCPTFNRAAQRAMNLPEFAPAFAGFEWPWFFPSAMEYQQVVGGISFGEVRAWIEPADRFFPDAEALVRWIDQPCLVPFLRRLDQTQGAAFRERVIRNVIATSRQRDGRCFEQFRRLHFRARR